MRPLKLELKGFTAFRDAAAIDFTELDVFAISGPTGSGKSSLLDAMTYALYGEVERVGHQVGQLISQGQPRMAVTLEFEVGRDRYKLTRSTPAKGATKIQLMRQANDEWQQAGEGSDRVRDVEKMLIRIIGLTYDGFTRSVLLPQGKFAEFLVGDASKRRDILTELLGLSLFRRMAERAGAIAKESAVRSQERALTLEREYAEVTREALKEARASAKEAVKREKALVQAGERVVRIVGRWEEAKRSADELRAIAAQAADEAQRAEAAALELATLAVRLAGSELELERRAGASKAAQEALDGARAELRNAEATWGPAMELSATQVSAHRLAEVVRGRDRKDVERTESANRPASLAAVLERAQAQLTAHGEALATVEGRLRAAETKVEEARHVDLVWTVSAGLKPGDPCPVCGQPLARTPKRAASSGLDRAAKTLEGAKKDLETARAEVRAGERAVDTARRELDAAAADQARLAGEIDELEAAIDRERSSLVVVLGEPLPDDPAGEIEARLAELQRLDRLERDATRQAADASQILMKAEQERDRVASMVDRHRDRLSADLRPLFDRAARAVGVKAYPVTLIAPPHPADATALKGLAEEMAAALTVLAERLAGEIRERASLERRLLQEATDTVGDLVGPAPTLEALAESVTAACRAATIATATTAKEAEDLTTRLDRRKQLAAEVQELERRALLFRSLAQELRADHLIAFLQAEALQVLAAAGSERLQGLSEGRYRLLCREDEFLVVDTWNGDEERSVRTLSGGETFLAALALSLALADQVRSLSVTDRARLDSLFLDEGFGTLDPDSLRTVTDAIERLAGDGRLVGVITHVKELAEQFSRIEVRKSHAGSRLELVP